MEIESAEEQMKLVSGITAEMLEKSLAAPSYQDPQEYIKRIQQAWISGDTAQLEKVIQSQPSDPVEFAKSMLQDRNLRMADAAEQFLKGKEPAFVVVGAAHMVGPDGVVQHPREARVQGGTGGALAPLASPWFSPPGTRRRVR